MNNLIYETLIKNVFADWEGAFIRHLGSPKSLLSRQMYSILQKILAVVLIQNVDVKINKLAQKLAIKKENFCDNTSDHWDIGIMKGWVLFVTLWSRDVQTE